MELFLCVAKLLAQLSQLGFQFIPSPANLASLMFDPARRLVSSASSSVRP